MDLDMNKQSYEQENYRKIENDLNHKIDDLYREIDGLKNDKHYVNTKLNDRERENDDLKNEVFMLKKIIVDIERRDVEINNLKYKRDQDDGLKRTYLRDRKQDERYHRKHNQQERHDRENEYNMRESIESNTYALNTNEYSPVRDIQFSSNPNTRQQNHNVEKSSENTYGRRAEDHVNIITWKASNSPDKVPKQEYHKQERTPNRRCVKHAQLTPERNQINNENFHSSPPTNNYDSQFTMESYGKFNDKNMSDSAYGNNRENSNQENPNMNRNQNEDYDPKELPVRKKGGVKRFMDHTIYQESVPYNYSGVYDGPAKDQPGRVGSKFDQIPKRSAPTIKPTMQKHESELTGREKQKKFYDIELLKLQVERDRIDNVLSKIEASGKNNAHILREKRQLTSD